MTKQSNSAPVLLAFIVCCVTLLSGCAGLLEQPTDSPSSQSQTHPIPPENNAAVDATLPEHALQNSDLAKIDLPVQFTQVKTIDLTWKHDDVFEQLRQGFAMPDINDDLVLYHQQWYLNRPDYLRRMVDRGSRYLYHIVDELDKRGMPMELALLPMVESAYNPMALSRSKASGLWQFIPSTGKYYNLDQNWWQDDRRDIVASTSAALDYLQIIYEMHGDWHLALASYNWGEGAVGRAIEKNRAQNLPTDYLSLTLPDETRNYVPKLQALKNIFGNPSLFSELNLPKVPNEPFFATITTDSHIDVKLAAKLAEMPIKEFQALNPAHNRPVIKPDTALVIPTDKVETFTNNLKAHESGNKPLSEWETYTLRAGDTVDKVASRFGMTTAQLREANGIDKKSRPTPGTSLLVIGRGKGKPLNIAALSGQLHVSGTDSIKGNRTHTIRKGETLQGIAKQYGMRVDEIKRINGLHNNTIVAGKRLQLAATATKSQQTVQNKVAKEAKTTVATQQVSPPKSIDKTSKTTNYLVQRGDTFYSIARQFNVALNDLMRLNQITPNKLKPGVVLSIPQPATPS